MHGLIFSNGWYANQLVLNRIYHTIQAQAGVWLCSHVPFQRLFDAERQWKVLDKALKKQSYDHSDYMFNVVGVVYCRERFKK